MKGAIRLLGPLLIGLAAVPGWAAATVDFPSGLNAGPATQLVVPVVVSSTEGVSGLELRFDYDETVLEVRSAYRTSATGAFSLDADLTLPGRVALNLQTDAPLDASVATEVCWVLFDVVGPAGSIGELNWFDAKVNGFPAATLVDRSVEIRSAGTVVDVPADVQAQPGVPLMVPVETNDAAGAESFDIIVRYNPDIVTPLTVQKGALTQSMSLNFFLGFAGEVRISLFAVQPLGPGGGPIVQITFDPVGGFGDATPLDLTRGRINEGVIPTVLDDGLLEICDLADGDGDGFSGCAGDCDNDDPNNFPGNTEVCDGRDNDCDTLADNGIAPPFGRPDLLAAAESSGVRLDWTTAIDSTGYDLLRGSLIALRSSGGEFAGAACLADDQETPSFIDVNAPDDSWYLVRGTNCGGGGSYDTGEASQASPRDPSIFTAPAACP